MSKDNQAQRQQSQQSTPKPLEAAVAEAADTLAAVRADLSDTRTLVLALAESVLKNAKSHAKCRNCTRLACQFITAHHREFGTQDIPLCNGCELTDEWRSTGTTSRITDAEMLETIRIANEIICSLRR